MMADKPLEFNFKVGDRRVRFTVEFSKTEADYVRIDARWWPAMPPRFSPAERDQYERERDAIVTAIAVKFNVPHLRWDIYHEVRGFTSSQ